jgi:hypothetical protein
MTTRRDFIRQGALWVAGALIVEPPLKRLWAFPSNPLTQGRSGAKRPLTNEEVLDIICKHNEMQWERLLAVMAKGAAR